MALKKTGIGLTPDSLHQTGTRVTVSHEHKGKVDMHEAGRTPGRHHSEAIRQA